MAHPSLSTRLNSAQPYVLSLFRIVVGLLFTCHGARSLFGVLGGTTVPAGTWPDWYAAAIELVGGSLVLLGLGTRSAAFTASGSMAYAYFNVHQPDGLFPIQNSGEGAAMFCWSFLLLVFTGPGPLALDRLFAPGEGRAANEDRGEQSAPVTA
ncbi:putative oxidoreductase [Streptomyces sp. SLBN-118]|uniref:DoxX family protein n=1 Tax=Streptomyces sp. SLBN-118 TaxID=2768454 RepID=UPI0011546B4F|nr:DoxX family protein [Streptomyces sp. SLBN-118]TQK44255.1 putative oxidoreductase [Streptomyces sp. SLBN-118]